jgi:hypothetical protein
MDTEDVKSFQKKQRDVVSKIRAFVLELDNFLKSIENRDECSDEIRKL